MLALAVLQSTTAGINLTELVEAVKTLTLVKLEGRNELFVLNSLKSTKQETLLP